MSTQSIIDDILNFEKSTIHAFKEKQADIFTKYFSADYIGVANDGVKDAAAEIKAMLKLNIDDIAMQDEKIFFPESNVAIMTYKMIVNGKLNKTTISGGIFCSTVYLKMQDGWRSILHTESKAG